MNTKKLLISIQYIIISIYILYVMFVGLFMLTLPGAAISQLAVIYGVISLIAFPIYIIIFILQVIKFKKKLHCTINFVVFIISQIILFSAFSNGRTCISIIPILLFLGIIYFDIKEILISKGKNKIVLIVSAIILVIYLFLSTFIYFDYYSRPVDNNTQASVTDSSSNSSSDSDTSDASISDNSSDTTANSTADTSASTGDTTDQSSTTNTYGPATKTTLSAGNFTVGTDINPGRYTITPGGSSGNLAIYDSNGDIIVNQILDPTGQLGDTSYTCTLTAGDLISINNMNSVIFTPTNN